jgi:hypothetical protein
LVCDYNSHVRFLIFSLLPVTLSWHLGRSLNFQSNTLNCLRVLELLNQRYCVIKFFPSVNSHLWCTWILD